MTEEEAKDFLVDILGSALDERVSFVMMGSLFPGESREKAVKAFKLLGYTTASEMLDSITSARGRQRLWD